MDARTFWFRVDVGSDDECWSWLGAAPQRYGNVLFPELSGRKKPLRAHRVAWALTKGDGTLPPDGVDVHHTCENKICVNPSHLELLPHREHAQIHAAGHPGCRIHGREFWTKSGHCGDCRREYGRRWRAKAKAA